MNILKTKTIFFELLLVCVAALFMAGLPRANGQVVQPSVGTAFVYPVPQQIEQGPVLDVIPNVLSDGYTINLTLIPSLTEFAGYDNPNEVGASGALPPGTVLIPTVLPRFTVRQVVTTVNVWDGQTIVLGGLISENVQSIKDKVPVLGDVPVLGRLFRSESKVTNKKNLIIFVTPRIIDPAGNPAHSDDEMPFAQNSFPPPPHKRDAESVSEGSTNGVTMSRSAEERTVGGGSVPRGGIGAPVGPVREFARGVPRLRTCAKF